MSSFGKKNTPQEISGILEKVLGHKKIKEKAKSFSFITAWENVVGDDYAKISYPETLLKGMLTVKVIDTAYAQELSMQKEHYLEKLVELGYSGAVTDMKFISGNPKEFRNRQI